MGYNSKELRVSKDPKKPSKPKDTDYVSKMGYRDDSPFRNQEAINIYTPNGTIDMSNTGIPLMANGRYLPPYSGQHRFNTTNVLEQRMASGGEVDADKAYSFLLAKSIYGHPLSAAQTRAFERIAGVRVDENGDIIEEGEEGDDESVSYDDEDSGDMSYEKRGGSTRGKRTSKNIKTSVNKLLQRNAMLYGPSGKNLYDPSYKTGGWLDKAQDGKIQLEDKRFLDPISGNPLKQGNRKGYAVDSVLVDDLIQRSYKAGVNPNTTLAMGLQETGLGYGNEMGLDARYNPLHLNKTYGEGKSDYLGDTFKLLQEKNKLADRLGKTDEASRIQAWNGYGTVWGATPMYGLDKKDMLSRDVPMDGVADGSTKKNYGISMSKNPVYGKTVVNLRDSVIAQNPQIQAMVKKYAPAEPKPKPVVNYPYAPTYGKNPQAQPYDYSSTGKGLAKQQMGGWLDQYQTAGATGPKFDRSLMGEMSMPSETVQSQVAPLPYMLTSSKDPVKDFKKSKQVQQSKEQEQARIKQQGTLSQGYAEGDPRNPNFIEEPYYAGLQNRPVGEHGSLALQNQMSVINQMSLPMYLTPPGMVAGVIQGGYELPNNLEEGNYGDALINLLQIAPGARAFPKGYANVLNEVSKASGLSEAQIALGQELRKTFPGALQELYNVANYYRPFKGALTPYAEKVGNFMKMPFKQMLSSGSRVPNFEGVSTYNPLKMIGNANLLDASTAISGAGAAKHFMEKTGPSFVDMSEHPSIDKTVSFARNLGADAVNLIPVLNTKVSDLVAPLNWAGNEAIHKLERFLAGKLIKDPIKNEVKNVPTPLRKNGGASNNWLPNNHYQNGGTVAELWEEVTGTPWKEAHERGLTDGSYEMNMQLRKLLLGEKAQLPVSHPASLPANAIHAPVRQQVPAKVQQAPMPRINPSLMGAPNYRSESVQSQSPLSKYAAAEQNKVASKGYTKDEMVAMQKQWKKEEDAENLRKAIVAAERDLRIAKSYGAQNKDTFGNPEWRSVLAEETGAIGDKLRISNEENFFDDYINYAAWIGNMASSLGQSPLRAQQEDSYMPYLKAVGEPLVMGAIGPYIGKAVGYVTKPIVNAATKKITPLLDNLMLSGFKKAQPAAFGITNPLADAERLAIQDARTIGKKMDVFEKPDYRPNLIKGKGYSSTQAADIYEIERIKTLVESNASPTVLKKYGYTPKTLAKAYENIIVKNEKIVNLVESKANDAAVEAAGYTRKELNAAYKKLFPTNQPSMVKGADGELVPWTYQNKTLKPIEKVLDIKDVKAGLLKDIKVERGSIDNPFFGKQSNPVIDFFRKKGVVPAIERQYMPLATEAEHAMMNTNTVMANLFGKDVVSPGKEIIKVLADVEAQPKGFAFKGSNSLSSDSFGLYNKTATAAIEKGKVKPTLLGYQKLNDFGYSEQAGVNKQSILNMLNEQIGQFNKAMQGKYKLPNAFVQGQSIMYPDMGLIRKQFGGGQSMPYVHYQLGGGWLDQYQTAGPVWQDEGSKNLKLEIPKTGLIDRSLMDQPNFASETTQSQAPMSKYAAEEQNKAAVKAAIEEHAKTVYNKHLQREELKKKYPTKNQEEIQRIQDKIQSPWFNEPAGQLASYITRFHGLTDDELGDITGSGTMGNRLGVAANMAGWGIANELGGKLIGKGLEYASPYIEKGLGYIGGKLAKYLPKEINPVVGEQLQRLEGLGPVPPPPTYEQYAASNLDPVPRDVYERFNRAAQSSRTAAPIEQTPMNRVLTERWGNQANLVDPNRTSPYYNNRQVEIPRNFATELEGDEWMQAMEHNLGNDPRGYMNRALTNKYGQDNGVMALQNQVRSQAITPVEGYNRLHNALRAESNNYHNWTTTAEASNPVSRPAASYKPEIASLKEVKNVDKGVIDKVDKYMQRPIHTTGYQSYDTNSILGKVERVTSTSSIPKTEEIPDLITSFEKVYEKVKGKNPDLERKLRVQLEDLRGTNWLRTTGKAELEAQGLKPKDLAIIDSGRGQIKNLVDKEGNIVGTIMLSGSDSPVVSATGVNYKFHGYKLKDANAVKEAEAQLSERLLKDKATREALGEQYIDANLEFHNPYWSQGVYDELMSPEYSNLYKPEAEKTLAQLLDNNQNRYGDMLYRGVHHGIKDTRGPLESHAHFVQTTLPDAISNIPKTLYRGQNYWESGIKRGTHELTPNGALRVVRKSGGEGWLDNY